MTVDQERLRALLDRLRATEAELERLRALDSDVVRHDIDRLNSVKYLFVMAAEVAIHIGQHIIASEGLDAPTTFASTFTVLAEAGWLPADLAATLGDIARFRNLLVHGYADVDDDRVIDILQSRLDDLTAFRRQIASQV